MLHLGGKTWRSRPADGDKSSEQSGAEWQPKKTSIVTMTQKIDRCPTKISETERNYLKVAVKTTALAQKQSVNHCGAFMSV